MNSVDRFHTKYVVDGSTGCWVWQAETTNGYGRFKASKKKHRAHRWAYISLVGPIPANLDLDHLCRNRSCVNPKHLEPVTRRENLLRSPLFLDSARRYGKQNAAARRKRTDLPDGISQRRSGSYQARVRAFGNNFCGSFGTIEEAVLARKHFIDSVGN